MCGYGFASHPGYFRVRCNGRQFSTVPPQLQVYGPSAWWWEVEELIRKLLLSAVVVLIEPGSPLQVHAASVACMLKNYEGGWGVVWGFINCGRGGVVIVA